MANTQFSINDIINNQVTSFPLPTENVDTVQAVPVRYEGGETAKDRKGNVFTRPANPVEKLQGKEDNVPLTAKKGEPENKFEWAQDIANETIKTGKDPKEVYESLRKKYPFSAARIDDEINDSNSENPTKKHYRYLDEYTDTDGESIYYDPSDVGNKKVAQTYKLPGDEYRSGALFPSSSYLNLLKGNKLLDRWNNFMNAQFSSGSATLKGDIYKDYNALANEINKLRGITDLKTANKYGFESIDDYKIALNQLYSKLGRETNKYIKFIDESNASTNTEENAKDVAKQEQVTKVEPKAAEPKPVAKTEEVAKPTPTATVEETPEAKVEENIEPEAEPADSSSFTLEQAKLEGEMSEQEKLVLQEAEEIADREKTEKEAQEADKEIEDAYRKRLQDQFDYEDWLKNPSIISGIFGKSGLSKARRFGLGLSALFAIFSDACSNFARGLNRNTDFKNEAFDALNSTIVKIQDARADKIGVMASKPYETTSENEEKLNRDYEKLRRLPAGAYIPESTLKAFIQESQVDTTSPISEELYNSFNAEAKEGFINSISKNNKLKSYYITEDGELTPAGELQFLNKQEQALNQYRSVLGLSDERIGNIMNLLNLEKERAETRKKVHDVVFSTNADYINSINAMEDETRVLETAKLDFTEARTLDQLLDLSNKFRNTVAGLATSTESENDAESLQAATLERFTEQKGLEKVNEELNKHGWQAELNGEAGVKFPIKVVPISAEISGGGKWSAEQAEKHLQTEYERFSNDYQRSLNKARSSSRASGMSIDQAKDLILNFINTERAKGAEADFDAARKNIIDAINNKIQFNQDIIDELKEMRKRETRFDTGDNEGVSTANPYISMFNDVPTKNIDWYKNRLRLA